MNGFSRFTPAALVTSLVLSIFLPQSILALTTVLVTNISGNFNDMAASGNYLYAANNSTPPDSGLKIFDISNPTSPVDVGYRDGKGAANALAISGKRAFVVYATEAGIFDISTPTNPIPLGQISGNWTSVTVSDHLICLGTDFAPVSVFDFSNPANPVSLGTINGMFGGAALEDNYLYLAGFSPYGLSVYDFSNQTEPISVGPFQNRFGGYGLAASGDYLYLVDLTNGFWIFNISTRTNPVQVYRSTFLPAPTPSEVRVFGNYAFLGCNGGSLPGGSDGALIYDVSDPTNASFASSVYMPLPQSGLKALAVSGSYVYLAYFYGSQVSIFSLGIPSSTLGITPVTGDDLILSWPTPTTALAVQQSLNVSPPNWITLTNLPVVVGTNNQVTISRPPRTMFYRLVAR